jgi:ubiquinone/menaquinone biosynthesis C-methylase UbiE/uncharacterized protein YbaR (Trm112 family)
MTPKEVLEELLICPITHSELRWVTKEESALVPGLHSVDQPGLMGWLKANDHAIYYPIVDEIVFLLSRHAIRLEAFESNNTSPYGSEQTKIAIQAFYDNVGWKAKEGVYQDARDSEDLRPVSHDYIQHCHQRVKAHLPQAGRYLLDIACGPVQYPVYESYSEQYQYRICADLSLTALREAKQKLGDRGIYILCDITELPLQNNVADAVVSLHTLYHVPAEQQAKGFDELYRVLKVGGTSVIVYSWGTRSLLMNLFMFPFKLASYIRRKLFCKKANIYFYTHSYRWFCDEIKAKYNTELFSWRSVNVPFLKIFIHPLLGGHTLLKFIAYLEETFPAFMGRIGAYPLFVSVKK